MPFIGVAPRIVVSDIRTIGAALIEERSPGTDAVELRILIRTGLKRGVNESFSS